MNYKHLLSENGIMVSFSVAKKIPVDKLKKIHDKIKRMAKNGKNADELFKKEIEKQTKNTLNVNDIPGLITEENVSNNQDEDVNQNVKTPEITGVFKNEKKVMMLNFFGTSVARKMVEQKFKKDEICFIILTILGSLGIGDNDFKNFHKRNKNVNYLNEDENGDDGDEDNQEEY
jgi:hypothetical protein